ncbi:hypothetical protein RFI_28896 [Reticulomyxa filosa]|uniref:Uncharacterized protein n=1 Tax=Reticulomyxa filosa TaxID=46433 RepID=X6M4V3_RETFI|nr:hypothetical protein RFI_28896 [Reticulomyxa filosa]|eukprot:ETO08492.1 hypothetical protein RFI_28896 [Reticulomyxa filosa]
MVLKLKQYLQDHNIDPKKVGQILITFKICAWMTWATAVPICARLQPLRRLVKLSGPRRLYGNFKRKYPNVSQKFLLMFTKISRKFIVFNKKWIPEAFGQKHKDFGLAVAEATLLSKLLMPIWGPLEFLAIVRLYQSRWNVALPTIDELEQSLEQSSQIGLFGLPTTTDNENSDNV